MNNAAYDIRIDWDNDGDWSDSGDPPDGRNNVTSRALARTAVTIEYGRDQARAGAPITRSGRNGSSSVRARRNTVLRPMSKPGARKWRRSAT